MPDRGVDGGPAAYPRCGAPYARFTEESCEQIGWEVRLIRITHRRPAYRRTCRWPVRRVICAPPVPKAITRGRFTTGFLARLLVEKFVLASAAWTITATAAMARISPLACLLDYLEACAQAGGKAAEGPALARFFPWVAADAVLTAWRPGTGPARRPSARTRLASPPASWPAPAARTVIGPPGPAGPARYCGRDFSPADIAAITGLAAALPTRAAIAEAACQALDWRHPDGQTRAMSARVALSKMAADGLITLPPPRNGNGNGRIPRHRPAGQGSYSKPARSPAPWPASAR